MMQKLIVLTVLSLLTSPSWGHLKFTDDDLKHLVAKQRTGLIYLWSPFMPLSAQGRKEIGTVADELDVPVTTIIDPLADPAHTTDPLMASHILMNFGMLDHYPAIAFYKSGHLIEDVLVLGYEPAKTLTPLLKTFLEREDR